jgi:hypothetical protein
MFGARRTGVNEAAIIRLLAIGIGWLQCCSEGRRTRRLTLLSSPSSPSRLVTCTTSNRSSEWITRMRSCASAGGIVKSLPSTRTFPADQRWNVEWVWSVSDCEEDDASRVKEWKKESQQGEREGVG